MWQCRVWVRSRVRPTVATLMTAGSDADQSLTSNPWNALWAQILVRAVPGLDLTGCYHVGTPLATPTVAAAVPAARWAPPLVSAAQTMRAIVLAWATEASRAGRRSSSPLSQLAFTVVRVRAWRITALAPSTSNTRKYWSPCRVLLPLEFCIGTSPIQAASWRADQNWVASANVATIAGGRDWFDAGNGGQPAADLTGSAPSQDGRLDLLHPFAQRPNYDARPRRACWANVGSLASFSPMSTATRPHTRLIPCGAMMPSSATCPHKEFASIVHCRSCSPPISCPPALTPPIRSTHFHLPSIRLTAASTVQPGLQSKRE